MPAALGPGMTTRSMGFVAGWLMLAVATGCGSSVVENTGGTGGGGGTGGAGGNGGACAAFSDQDGQTSVTLRFHNDTGQPIFLPGDCQGKPAYQLEVIGAGEDGTSYPFDTSCLQTCADLQQQPPFVCDACAPAAIRIEPGTTREVVWDGTGLRPGFTMPPACWAAPDQGTSCSLIVAAPAGMWAAHAVAFSECTDGCTCKPDGSCFGTPSGQQAQADLASFSFPSETTVDVVFSGCAFGCP